MDNFTDSRGKEKKENEAFLLRCKKNKDNLCKSLLEIEKFLCTVSRAKKGVCLYKFLR